MRNSIYVIGKDIPVSWIPLILRISGPDIRGIFVYVMSAYTEDSCCPLHGGSVPNVTKPNPDLTLEGSKVMLMA